MDSLNEQQKELIFDYCLGLTTDEQSARAQDLIFSNGAAAELHRCLKKTIEPLETLSDDNCPDELAKGTVFRLTNLARASQLHLEQLLRDESTKSVPSKSRFWRNLAEMGAIAAVILFFAGVSVPTVNRARQHARQAKCQANLLQIARATDQYASDHQGRMPAVAIKEGHPWWKIGSTNQDNYSNTRPLWLLVKNGYVQPESFVCPGRKQDKLTKLTPEQIRDRFDFPSRQYVTYSFRLTTGRNIKVLSNGNTVLIADLNPVFESIYEKFSKQDCNEFNLQMRQELLKMNSINHNGRGQNVLFVNGSISFKKSRTIGSSGDDIFTVKGKKHYRGCEQPSDDDDAFLAP